MLLRVRRIGTAHDLRLDLGRHDALSLFTAQGRFIKRLVTGAPLAGPWGMVIAPADWGDFGDALLVGNVNDGMINVFDPSTGHLRGTLRNASGKAIVNPGLWGLAFGNGVISTPRTLLFAAGIGSAPGGFGQDVLRPRPRRPDPPRR